MARSHKCMPVVRSDTLIPSFPCAARIGKHFKVAPSLGPVGIGYGMRFENTSCYEVKQWLSSLPLNGSILGTESIDPIAMEG